MSTSGLRDSRYLDILRRLGEESPNRSVLSEIVDRLLEILDAERVFLFRFRKAGGFRVLVGRDIDGEDIPRPQQRISHHAIRKMEKAGTVWVVPDARQDRRYRSEDVFLGRKPPMSILLFPLRMNEEVVGGIYADHRFRTLDEGDAQREEVQAWVGLSGVALSLREQLTRLRWAEKKLEAEKREPRVIRRSASRRLRTTVTMPEPQEFHGMLSANPDVLDLFDALRRLSNADIPVLICGETGVGKSLLARVVHESSSRAGKPFETVSCGGLPDSLMESELLGHVKGAFTGAETDHTGILVSAHGGTLFLDEVGDMCLEMQTKLLRVLEGGNVRPLGSKDVFQVDVRLVSSTRHDLERLVDQERFRRDLYFRLKSLVLDIPPLRERREDISGLTRHLLRQYNWASLDHPDGVAPQISPEVMERLSDYFWPGNVRELENEIRRLAALGFQEITVDSLGPFLRDRGTGSRLANVRGGVPLEDVVATAEQEAIEAALRRCSGNKSQAADELGITRKALYRRLKKYGLLEGRADSDFPETQVPQANA